MQAPSGALAEWMKALYKELIDSDLARESRIRCEALGVDVFLKKCEALSDDADRAILAASIAGDIPAMNKYFKKIDLDIMDVIIFRFHFLIDELEESKRLFAIPDHGLSAPEALRLFLIENDTIRREIGGLN